MSTDEQEEDLYKSLSPHYLMGLISRVQTAIEETYPDADDRELYLDKWHENYDYYGDNQNFYFDTDGEEMNLKRTLHNVPPDVLIRIAIDLGVDTPGFLPSIPTFENVLKEQNPSALSQFERATKNVYAQPDEAISLAYSTYESVLKTIAADKSLDIGADLTSTVGRRLANAVLPALGLKTGKEIPKEINKLVTGLSSVSDAIITLRNDKSASHGSVPDSYVIDDSLWAELVINSTATLGLFLWRFYEKDLNAR